MTKKKKGKKADPKTAATKASKKQEATKAKEASEQADQEVIDGKAETEDASEKSTEEPAGDEEPVSNKVLSEIKRDFWITLSAEDKAERGQQYARMEIEIEREKDYQKIEKDRMKEKLSEMATKSRKFRDAYLSGEEQIEIICTWETDYQRGRANLIRSDSGAIVQTRDLTSHEQREHQESLQSDLFEDENGKSVAIIFPKHQINKDEEQEDVYHIVIVDKQIGSVGKGKHDEYYAVFQPDDEDTAESLGTSFDSKQTAIDKILEKYADHILNNDAKAENASGNGEPPNS